MSAASHRATCTGEERLSRHGIGLCPGSYAGLQSTGRRADVALPCALLYTPTSMTRAPSRAIAPPQLRRNTSRDTLLLLASWAVVLFSAAALWANLTSETSAVSATAARLSAALVLFVLALPPLIGLLALSTSGRQWLLSGLRLFQLPSTEYTLLFAFGLAQLLGMRGGETEGNAAGYLTAIVAALSVLWLFLHRDTVDPGWVAGATTWVVVFLTAERGFGEITGHIDLLEASWRGRALYGFFALSTAFLLALPLLCLSTPLRERIGKTLRRADRAPGWLIGAVLAATFLLQLVNQWTDWESLRARLALQACLVVVALVAGWLAFTAPRASPADRAAGGPRLSRRAYWICLGLVLGTYALLAIGVDSDAAINPDGLSYLTIGRSYAEGQLVVRGYWSPLLSWLIAPAIALGADPYVGYKVVAGLSGLLWGILAAELGARAGLAASNRLALTIAICLIALRTAFYPITPDLLAAGVFALYLYLITHPGFPLHPVRFGVLTGLVAALGYYAKYYNFPFFLIHYPLSCIVLWSRPYGRRVSLRGAAAGLAAFAIACLPWILAISLRYGHPTITTSSAISRAIVGPNWQTHPCGNQLCTEPEDVLFPWEDPQSRYYQDLGWSPLESLENLRHQIRLTWSNASKWLGTTLFSVGPIPAMSLFGLALAGLILWGDPDRKTLAGWTFITIALYASGYMLTFGEPLRYYYPLIPLLWIAFLRLLDPLRQAVHPLLRPHWARGPMWLLLLALPVFSFSWLWPIVSSVRVDENTCLREASEAVSDALIAPMAGTSDVVSQVSYYTRTTSYGVIPANLRPSEVNTQLRTLGIKTVVVAPPSSLAADLTAAYGYSIAAEVDVCDIHLVVLRVPDA